ncbi:heme exporter protein D [Pseudomonas psychrotolerans]|uniref:Heme exporter protein D n=1 Tax=Pseudomonas oryzihabitans TaxID=47885 RepID=A0AAJ2BPT6_9PSED|nr:heme exporter protein D [Pseudomonas psychrotolerans]MDR6355506.1 heme exporter protein D [Pseudomonas psychrotolerans]
MSEPCPNQLRGLLTGVAVQWLCNATVAFSFPVALEAIGNYTFYVFAAINLGSLVFVYFCLPETRGKSLEDIERHLKKEL